MAAKVIMQVGFASLRVLISPAVDDESSDRFTVCTGDPEGTHPPARTRQSQSCTDPNCSISHRSAYGFAQRGVELGDQVVLLSQEEIQNAKGAPRTGRVQPIEVAFHNREKVFAATVASKSVQNVLPDKGFEKTYVVLRDALARNPEIVACTVWAPKSANSLWVLEVVGDRIVASQRCWPEYVRAVPAVPHVDYLDAELAAMETLVNLTEDFDLSIYSDQAKAGVDDLLASKSGTPVASTPVGAQVDDLLASLQRSVAAKQPAKKTAARKAPAKKVAKKTTTRKKVAA